MKRCRFCMTPIQETLLVSQLFKRAPVLCPTCHEAMTACRFDEMGRCTYCKGVLDETGCCISCRDLQYRDVCFENINAQFHYQHFVKTLMHQFKFLNDVAIAEIFAAYVRIPHRPDELIIPMPSSEQHDFQRTFNPVQMVLTAQRRNFLPCLKMHPRSKQFALSSVQRHHAPNPIYFESDICIENRSVLLIDDIYTTGHTAHCAGHVLLQQKVRKLSMLTFAR